MYSHNCSNFPPNEQHTHYHYHYHYPTNQIQPQPQVHYPSRQNMLKYPPQCRNQSPHTYASSIEMNQWKKHLNPEVSRMYDQFNGKQSRFSQNNYRIAEEDEVVEGTSPRKSNGMLETRHQYMENSKKTQLSKIQQLYYTQKGRKNNEPSQTTKITQINPVQWTETDQLKQYERQVMRLKMVQEQCNYLRSNFIVHLQRRHPEQFNC